MAGLGRIGSSPLSACPLLRKLFFLLFFLRQEFLNQAANDFAHFGIVIHAIMLQPLVEFLGKVHVEFLHV